MPPFTGYVLFYNATAPNGYAMELKRIVDQILLQNLTMDASANVTTKWKSYPWPKPRVAGYDVLAANGGVWL